MKGLELSRAYYEEYGKPMIDTQLAQYKPYLAAGLVGEGSECLGFDDELSTDHDFGPAFCLWMWDKRRRAVLWVFRRVLLCGTLLSPRPLRT